MTRTIARVPPIPSSHVAFVAVDPGKRTGWARFDYTGRLVACGITDGDNPKIEGAVMLVIEHPHEGDGKASKKDLMTIARRMQNCIHVVGALYRKEVLPIQWKGNVPKVQITPAGKFYPAIDRILAKLSRAERAVLDLGLKGQWGQKCSGVTVAHNVIDSVGIGLWWTEVKDYPYAHIRKVAA